MAQITDLQSLKNWFVEQKKPYWTLYNNSNVSRSIIARNESIEDIDASWQTLRGNIESVSRGGPANIRVFVTDKAKHNSGFEVEARIFSGMPGMEMAMPGMPGIAGHPAGMIDESRVNGMIEAAREKWELEAKIQQLENAQEPEANWIDKLTESVERIGATPLGAVLMQRLMGMTPVAPVAPMNGVPSNDEQDNGEEYTDDFYNNIEDAAETLGVSPEKIAAKLAALVKANPEIAKNMLQ
jgi:hypothetical protein